MSNPPPVEPFLLPEDDFSCPVSFSRRFLTNKDDRTLAKSCEIRRVSHFKDVAGVHHELVLVEVDFPSNSNTITTFLQIERCGRNGGLSSSKFSSSAHIAALLSNGKAEDTILIPGTKTRENESFDKRAQNLCTTHHRLRTIYPSIQCSVAHLLVMLNVLRDCSPHYTLQKQCYWFAGTLCNMLQVKFKGKVSDNAEEGRAGTFKSIPVAKCPVQPEDLKKFDEAWKAFCDREDQEQQVSTLE
jgi:hypothetical protein